MLPKESSLLSQASGRFFNPPLNFRQSLPLLACNCDDLNLSARNKLPEGILLQSVFSHFLKSKQFQGTRRCLRTHPNTVTAGLLPFGPDPVWLGPPRLETASHPPELDPRRNAKQGSIPDCSAFGKRVLQVWMRFPGFGAVSLALLCSGPTQFSPVSRSALSSPGRPRQPDFQTGADADFPKRSPSGRSVPF